MCLFTAPKIGILISPSTPGNQGNQMEITGTANTANILSSIDPIQVLSL